MDNLSLKSIVLYVIFATIGLSLSACGGSEDGGGTSVESLVKTGIFTDSAVQGLRYRTDTQSGTTTADGEFTFIEGESISFSIGELTLGSLNADTIITPLDLVGTDDINNQAAINVARLLQTLDADSDPTNGITITEEIHQAITETLTIDFADNFDAEVVDVLTALNKDSADLVSATDAKNHLQDTLSTLPPATFSAEYLRGKTLYIVWFGEGDVGGGNPQNVPVVAEVIFNTENSVSYLGLLNDDNNQTFFYDITASGVFHVDEDTEGSGNKIVCGSTSDFIKTHYIEDGMVDNVDLFFFERQKALDYSDTLTQPIPACTVIEQRVIPTTDISVDGGITDWENIAVALTDAQADVPLGSTDLVGLYLAQDVNNLYVRLDRAAMQMPIEGAFYNYWVYFESVDNGPEFAIEIFHNGRGGVFPRLLDSTGVQRDYFKLIELTSLNNFNVDTQYIEIAVPKSFINTSSEYTVDFFTHFSHTADTWDDNVEEYDNGYDSVDAVKYLFRFE